eukprot:1247523-Amphidinium_carterae.1
MSCAESPSRSPSHNRRAPEHIAKRTDDKCMDVGPKPWTTHTGRCKGKPKGKCWICGSVDHKQIGSPYNPYRQPTYSQPSAKDDFTCDDSQNGYPKQPHKKKVHRVLKTKKQLTPAQLAAFQTLQSLAAGSTAPA